MLTVLTTLVLTLVAWRLAHNCARILRTRRALAAYERLHNAFRRH